MFAILTPKEIKRFVHAAVKRSKTVIKNKFYTFLFDSSLYVAFLVL